MPGASDGQVNGNGRFEIALLGGFGVRRGGRLLLDSSWNPRKAQALLKLLAVRGGPASR